MSDLIDREQAKDAIDKYLVGKNLVTDGTMMARLINELVIDRLPPAQPKRGKWIDRGEHGDWEWQADGRGKHWHEWECNKCHHYFDERTFFCPHCGADMREVTI